jgi:hypothetical protein
MTTTGAQDALIRTAAYRCQFAAVGWRRTGTSVRP